MAIRTVGPSGRDYTTVQAAVNAAVAGDIIQIDANTLFSESVVLPDKGVLADYITLTTNAAAGVLPAAGVRTSPAFASQMPRLQSTNGGAATITIAPSANHYKLQHLQLLNVPLGFRAIVEIGDAGSTTEAQEPADVIIDQCYLHGGVICGQKRGVECSGKRITITNNYMDQIKSIGQDSQAIAGWNGHGPVTILNNYISAGTEPIMFGGSDPAATITGTVTGSATTTTAAVSLAGGHTLAELRVGQDFSIKVGGSFQFTTLTNIAGSGATGTLTFTAISGAPDIPGALAAGPILDGLTVQRNYIYHDPAWFTDGFIPKPTGTAAVPSTSSGTLPAGTYYYSVAEYSTAGYIGITVNSIPSLEAPAILAGPGRVTISCSGTVPGTTTHRIWRGTVAGAPTVYHDTATLALVDDGSLTWTAGSPAAGSFVDVKNAFEIKAAQNVQVDSNIFDYHWRGVDVGKSVWLKTVNQDGGAPYLQSRNIVFEKNWIRHCAAIVTFVGHEQGQNDVTKLPGKTTNVTVRNNLWSDSGAPWDGGDLFAFGMTGVINLTLDHNTVLHTTSGLSGGLIAFPNRPGGDDRLANLVITNNLMRAETYGMHEDNSSQQGALDAAAPGWTFAKNAVADGSVLWPTNNFYPVSADWQNEFVNHAGGDWHLKLTSPYHHAGLDGKDLGADIDLMLAATAGVELGGAVETPPPPPSSTHRHAWGW